MARGRLAAAVGPGVAARAVRFNAETAAAYVMALLLVLELRLWDDLCDLELDRQIHPDRVLCQSASVRPFLGLFFILMAINFALVLSAARMVGRGDSRGSARFVGGLVWLQKQYQLGTRGELSRRAAQVPADRRDARSRDDIGHRFQTASILRNCGLPADVHL